MNFYRSELFAPYSIVTSLKKYSRRQFGPLNVALVCIKLKVTPTPNHSYMSCSWRS